MPLAACLFSHDSQTSTPQVAAKAAASSAVAIPPPHWPVRFAAEKTACSVGRGRSGWHAVPAGLPTPQQDSCHGDAARSAKKATCCRASRHVCQARQHAARRPCAGRRRAAHVGVVRCGGIQRQVEVLSGAIEAAAAAPSCIRLRPGLAVPVRACQGWGGVGVGVGVGVGGSASPFQVQPASLPAGQHRPRSALGMHSVAAH